MTHEGRKLIAHELTHVVQQAGLSPNSQPKLGAIQDTFEREADRISNDIDQNAVYPSENARKTVAFIQRMEDTDIMGDFERSDDEVLDGDSLSGALFDVDMETEESNLDFEESSSHLKSIQFKKRKDTPNKSKAQTTPRTITQINVDLSSQTLSITWNAGTPSKPIKISSGKGLPDTKDDPCKNPNVDGSNCTPTGEFLVGKKGGVTTKIKKGSNVMVCRI